MKLRCLPSVSATLLAMGMSVSVLATGQSPVANPALNPVQFKSAPKHEPLRLVENGKLNFAIAFDQRAEDLKDRSLDKRRSIRQGVQALQEAFMKCVGQEPPVIDANSPDAAGKYPYLLLVGKNALTDKLGMDPLALPKEGFEVLTFTGGVAIAGYDGSLAPGGYSKLDWNRIRQNGTSHGAYDFIERFLGVRYYFPGPGVVWPKVANLTVQPVHYLDRPVFNNRFTHVFGGKKSQDFGDTRKIGKIDEQWPSAWGDYPEDWIAFEWRWRIARGSQFDISHCPQQPQLWLEAHPDKKDIMFYRDPSGMQYYDPRQHGGNYYDVSNLELADLYVEDCKRLYETGDNKVFYGGHHPNSASIPFGQCDTYINNMDTPAIRELGLITESRKGDRQGELSDIYARFHIALAGKIEQELPGKRLACMAYSAYTLTPVKPENRKFPGNVDMCVCVWAFPSGAMSEEAVAYWREQLKDWYAIQGGRPVASLYLYNTYTMPWGKAVIARHIGEVSKKMGKYLGREELIFDIGNLEWYYYPAYYCGFRAMWNPDFNVQAALDEHWPLLYGKAAPYLKEFDGILTDRWVKVFAKKGTGSEVYQEAYPLPLLDKLEGLLKQAEAALAPGSVEMLRFKLFAKPWPEAIQRMRGSILFKKPVYQVKRLAKGEAITIDGKPDEPVWRNAKVIPMQDPLGGGATMKAFSVRMLWDDEGLHISGAMAGKPLADPAQPKFNNDNLELFLSPGGDLNEFYHFMIDAAAQTQTGQKTLKPIPTPYNGNWECRGIRHAVSLQENGWSFEMYIPFKAMREKAPKPYSNWHVNIVGNKLSDPKEYSSFSLTQNNNHDPNLFGFIYFLGIGD